MFGKMLQQMGFWTTILSWSEPVSFRSRLKGDLLARLAIAFGVGLIATAVLLVLFAVNRNPPHPVFALIGLLLFGTMAGLVLLKGEATASGAVRVCEEGITRKRQMVPKIPVYQQFEEANWPFGSFSRAIFVPAQSIRQSFSVLVLTDERNFDLIGLPAKIDPAQLAQLLASRGVVVQQAHFVPQEFTRGINLPLAGAIGAAGLFASLGGLLFYAVSTAGPAPAVAERENVPEIAALDFGPPPPAPVIAAAPPPPPAVQPAGAPEAVAPENVPAANPPDDLPDGLPGFPRLRRPNPFEQPAPPANPFEAAATPPQAGQPPAAAADPRWSVSRTLRPLNSSGAEAAVVEAEQVQHRGVEVVDVDGVCRPAPADLVGLAVDLPALEAAAGHPEAEGEGVMVAARPWRHLAAAVFGQRRAAELAGEDDQRAVQ
jgi:hypothetical protein